MDARVTVDPIFEAFGVSATVTPPGADDAIDTTAVWMPTPPEDTGLEISRVVQRAVIALRVDEVPAAPPGTLIAAAEYYGGDTKFWRVDEIGRVEGDLIRVIVKPIASAEYLAAWGKT